MQIRSLINPELHLWFCRTGSVSVFRTVVGSEDHELVCSTRLKITFGLWIFMGRLRRKCRCDVSPPAVTCVFLTFETSGGADGCQSGWRTNSRSSCVNVRRGLPRLICSGLSRADRRRTRHSWHGSRWRASALEVILCLSRPQISLQWPHTHVRSTAVMKSKGLRMEVSASRSPKIVLTAQRTRSSPSLSSDQVLFGCDEQSRP